MFFFVKHTAYFKVNELLTSDRAASRPRGHIRIRRPSVSIASDRFKCTIADIGWFDNNGDWYVLVTQISSIEYSAIKSYTAVNFYGWCAAEQWEHKPQ